MTTKILTSNYGAGLVGARFTLTYADLTAAATTQTIALFTKPKGSKLMGVSIKHSTAFAGTAWSAATVSVGSATVGATGFASAFNIFQAVADSTLQETALFKSGTVAAEAINAYFTSTGGNLSVGTAGSVDIEVYYWNTTNS